MEQKKCESQDDTFLNIRNQFSSSLSSSEIKQYQLTGQNFYNMMNFDNLESPNNPENLLYVAKVINTTNQLQNT